MLSWDPNDYGGKETSGSVFFTYGLAWGINHNLLDSATYYPYVVKAWNGLVNDALHTNGSLGWMQSSGSKPADGQPLSYDKLADFEDFGLGGFLLAGSEVYRLAKDSNTITRVENQTNNEFQLSAYPNPFSESVRINLTPTTKDTNLFILNTIGQQVYRSQTENNQSETIIWDGNTSDGNQLPNGIYLILEQNKIQKQMVKVILRR